MSSPVRLSSVCRLPVTFVRPNQATEILSIKILRRSFQGNPSVGGVKHKRGSRVILDLSNAISRKRRKIGAKLVLITNRKLHMSFRLVPNSVTLDDLERRNSPNGRVISPNSVTFGTDYVKVVEDTPYSLQQKCRPKNLVFNDILFMAILASPQGEH